MESSGHKLIEQVVYAIVTHPMRQGQEKPNTMLWRERIFKKDWVITLLSRISRHRIDPPLLGLVAETDGQRGCYL